MRLSPADKAALRKAALSINYYQSHSGSVPPEIEERAKAYARESGEDIWAWVRCHVAASSSGD